MRIDEAVLLVLFLATPCIMLINFDVQKSARYGGALAFAGLVGAIAWSNWAIVIAFLISAVATAYIRYERKNDTFPD